MAAKKNTEDGNASSVTLSDKELEFLKAWMNNLTTKPEVDWDKLSTDLSLANGKCARDRFRQIFKKHGWLENAPAGGATTSASASATKPPKTPISRKKKASEGDEDIETPTKKRKINAKKAKAVELTGKHEESGASKEDGASEAAKDKLVETVEVTGDSITATED